MSRRIEAVRDVFSSHASGSQFATSPVTEGNASETSFASHLHELGDSLYGSSDSLKPLAEKQSGTTESKGTRLKEPGIDRAMAGLRKMSIVADIMDHRRESKAVKRREELKKMIRMVPDKS